MVKNGVQITKLDWPGPLRLLSSFNSDGNDFFFGRALLRWAGEESQFC